MTRFDTGAKFFLIGTRRHWVSRAKLKTLSLPQLLAMQKGGGEREKATGIGNNTLGDKPILRAFILATAKRKWVPRKSDEKDFDAAHQHVRSVLSGGRENALQAHGKFVEWSTGREKSEKGKHIKLGRKRYNVIGGEVQRLYQLGKFKIPTIRPKNRRKKNQRKKGTTIGEARIFLARWENDAYGTSRKGENGVKGRRRGVTQENREVPTGQGRFLTGETNHGNKPAKMSHPGGGVSRQRQPKKLPRPKRVLPGDLGTQKKMTFFKAPGKIKRMRQRDKKK